MKKLSAVLVAACLLGLSAPSFAKVTPIKFAKGSYCGSFDGNHSGRTFTLHLDAGQLLEIGYTDYDYYSAKDIIVKDPKGRTLQPEEQDFDYGRWITRTKGVHKVNIIRYPNSTHAHITFCAY
ncbi:hypothetical protein B0181_03470 [Moraxella caviae]|uniref:Uncharacterized protein n=1 Tax=Moraxella caviae TaxID=34060 RepID=A0A1T0A7S4_9GAMM|nr:hypothetical protein [Moraxella caviae]OOR91371.1 hypothetical protein B0181_03470 [Moraxella caviae]STZ13986.1 Uncharacterised protein [Moraxella caviae]VEW13257.1 Uncharacterised protein [Moraxella caviae]